MKTLDARFEKALSALEPVAALRTLVFELSAEGFDKATILQIFEAQQQRRRSANRETDADAIMDVMDFLVGWCSPHMKLLPDEPVIAKSSKLSIYLEPDVAEFVRNYARQKNVETETIVNEWLRSKIAVIHPAL